MVQQSESYFGGERQRKRKYTINSLKRNTYPMKNTRTENKPHTNAGNLVLVLIFFFPSDLNTSETGC